ncbi:MAG: DNA-processing protein DprA [Desulfosalsimonadaceae bacterium]
MENIRPWLALKYVPGVGDCLYKNLLERFGSPALVFKASGEELSAVEGISRRAAEAIMAGPPSVAVNAELCRVRQHGCRIIPYSHEDYPPLLREIPDPPPLLYVTGRLAGSMPAVSIVGSRKATRYGKDMARSLASDLAGRGIAVVSGLARGIDTAAHEGAVSAAGQTVAVLGSGLSMLYPAENRRLAERISECGAVVSEFSMQEEPNAYNFPKRNRIISGMCHGTVVVEAAAKSGSLITARLAGEQGREVFAVPGNINSRTSQGAHNLLKQGARLVTSAEDVIEEFPHLFLKSQEIRDRDPNGNSRGELTDEETRVYELLEPYPVHIDWLQSRLGMDTGRIAAVLLNLEIKGLAVQLPGKYFATHGEIS